jgi:hypothetical protein
MKTYMQLEARVKALEDFIRTSGPDSQGDWTSWTNRALALLEPEKQDVHSPYSKCSCKHVAKNHAVTGLCCEEGCACMNFQRAS